MLLINLRWFLVGLLLLLVVTSLLAIWLDRWLERRQGPGKAGTGPDGDWQMLLASLPYGVLLFHQDGRCAYANPLAHRYLSLPAPCTLPDAPWTAQLAEDRQRLRAQPVGRGRFRTVTLAEEETIHWWVGAWGPWDLVVVQDATARYRAEQGARFLISDLSHELRTPLATLLTHLEVLRLDELDSATRAHSLDLMRAEAQRMARLVHELLELGRLETVASIEQRPVAVGSLAEAAVAQLLPQAREQGITLTLQGESQLPLVMGNADRLQQLFLILLDNAIKYSRVGDRVTLSLAATPAGIQIEVRDSGPGIPAEHLPHITRRFYRVPSTAQPAGSGLGLALASEIARRHGSKLDITSHHEGDSTGTWVCLTLPPAS